MQIVTLVRTLGVASIAAGTVAMSALSGNSAAQSQAAFPDGKAGFVVSHIAYALAADASGTGACPNGMTTGYAQAGDPLIRTAGAPPNPDDALEPTLERVLGRPFRDGAVANYCQNPELAPADSHYRIVSGANVQVDGIDLDGRTSRANGVAAAGTCAHDDFRATSGGGRVDNQFYRVVGCSNSFQSTGQSNGFESEMLTGAWGILITLAGVDDLRNDPDVEIGLYANADPIELSPSREAIPNATYAMQQDPHYRATTHGRIVDGVLTSDPVDVHFHWILNGMRLDRPINAARVRLTFNAAGGMEGYLAGYTPVDAFYNFQFGFRDGKDGTGALAPQRLRSISSLGYAVTQGHTCEGVYQALHANADGDRDPPTGQCTSISTQYRISAVPAFVVDAPSESVNADLDRAPAQHVQ